jgi:hypothetical protein
LTRDAEHQKYSEIAALVSVTVGREQFRNAEPRFYTAWTQSRRWMFGRIFGLDGREGYRKLRLEPLCCPHRLSRGTAPHEREYPRRKDRF